MTSKKTKDKNNVKKAKAVEAVGCGEEAVSSKTKKNIEDRLKEIEKRTREVDREIGRIEAELDKSAAGPSKVIEEDLREKERAAPKLETSCGESEEPKVHHGIRESYKKFVYKVKKVLR